MPKEIDVQKEIIVHFVTDGPAKGWVHTHGLTRFDKPELEIRNVPSLFMSSATSLLNGVADYMLNHTKKPILPGQNMGWDRATILHFHEGSADEAAGYNNNHYKTPVLTISALEPTCAHCDPKVKA
jgi:hypothetical protein